jgi:hypothetical protein
MDIVCINAESDVSDSMVNLVLSMQAKTAKTPHTGEEQVSKLSTATARVRTSCSLELRQLGGVGNTLLVLLLMAWTCC